MRRLISAVSEGVTGGRPSILHRPRSRRIRPSSIAPMTNSRAYSGLPRHESTICAIVARSTGPPSPTSTSSATASSLIRSSSIRRAPASFHSASTASARSRPSGSWPTRIRPGCRPAGIPGWLTLDPEAGRHRRRGARDGHSPPRAVRRCCAGQGRADRRNRHRLVSVRQTLRAESSRSSRSPGPRGLVFRPPRPRYRPRARDAICPNRRQR